MSVEKRERRKWWCCQSVVRLFFLSFFALRKFEFPAEIKKGGGKDAPNPLAHCSMENQHDIHGLDVLR